MSFISQKIKQKPTYRQILFQKVKAVRELQIDSPTHLSYLQAQFIVNQKTIKQSLIFLIFKQKYQDQFENVQNNWKNIIDNDKFIDDLFYLKKKVVEEQWIGERMKQQKLQQKQQKFGEFIAKTKNKCEVRNRLKTLKDELSIAQNKINMARNEDESIKLVKQYFELKNEQNFLKNRNRRLLSLQQQRSAQSMSKSNITAITEFQQKLDSLVNQNIRNRYIQDIHQPQTKINQAKTENDQKHNQLINSESKIKIAKLEKVFDSFAKKECKEFMLFEQMVNAQKFISLENYLKMISEVDLDSLLTLQQKVNIFKTNSSYEKRINFSQFINAIIEIAKKSSERLSINLDSTFFDHFIGQFLKKAKQNKRYLKSESVSIHEKTNTSNLRNKQTIKYVFKLHPHTGKLLGNISEQLFDRKKNKEQKFRKLREFNLDRKHSIHTTMGPIVEQYKIRPIDNKFSFKLIDIERQHKSTVESKSNKYRKNTYLNIYRNKIQQQSSKSPHFGQKQPQVSEFQVSQITLQNNLSDNSNVKILEDLKDIISIEEDDTFLTNHLAKKNNFIDSLKLGKRFQKVHF